MQLVVQGMPFRDAYQKVAQEVFSGQLPEIEGPRLPKIDQALQQIATRHQHATQWLTQQQKQDHECIQNLMNSIHALSVEL